MRSPPPPAAPSHGVLLPAAVATQLAGAVSSTEPGLASGRGGAVCGSIRNLATACADAALEEVVHDGGATDAEDGEGEEREEEGEEEERVEEGEGEAAGCRAEGRRGRRGRPASRPPPPMQGRTTRSACLASSLSSTLSLLGHAPPPRLCQVELVRLLTASSAHDVLHAAAGLHAQMGAAAPVPLCQQPAGLLCATLDAAAAVLASAPTADGRRGGSAGADVAGLSGGAADVQVDLLGLPLGLLCSLLARSFLAPRRPATPAAERSPQAAPGAHASTADSQRPPAAARRPADERRALMASALALFTPSREAPLARAVDAGARGAASTSTASGAVDGGGKGSVSPSPSTLHLRREARRAALCVLASLHAAEGATVGHVGGEDDRVIHEIVAWSGVVRGEAVATASVWNLVAALEEVADATAAVDRLLHALLSSLLPRSRFAPPQSTDAARATSADASTALQLGPTSPLDARMLRALWGRPMGTIVGEAGKTCDAGAKERQEAAALAGDWYAVIATTFAVVRRLVRLGLLDDRPSLCAVCTAMADLKRRLARYERQCSSQAANGGDVATALPEDGSQQSCDPSQSQGWDAPLSATAGDDGDATCSLRLHARCLLSYYSAVLAPRVRLGSAEALVVVDESGATPPAASAAAARKIANRGAGRHRREKERAAASSASKAKEVVVLSD